MLKALQRLLFGQAEVTDEARNVAAAFTNQRIGDVALPSGEHLNVDSPVAGITGPSVSGDGGADEPSGRYL